MSENFKRPYNDDKEILIINKPLARAIGLVSSVVLRDIDRWLDFNEQAEKTEVFIDNRWWSYSTVEEMLAKRFDLWCEKTVRNALSELENTLKILVSTSEYNKKAYDRTKWYTIDYDRYEIFMTTWKEFGEPDKNSKSSKAVYDQFYEEYKGRISYDNCGKFHKAIGKSYQSIRQDLPVHPARFTAPIQKDNEEDKEKETTCDPSPSASDRPSPTPPPVPSFNVNLNTVQGDEEEEKTTKKKASALELKMLSLYPSPKPLKKEHKKAIQPLIGLYDTDKDYKTQMDKVINDHTYMPTREKLVETLLNAHAIWEQKKPAKDTAPMDYDDTPEHLRHLFDLSAD
jgi:hypothetical protein